MGLFRKKKREPIIKLHTNSFGENMNRLTPEGDLPYGWYTANKEFTSKIESEYRHFLNAWLESRKKSDLEQYAALKSFVTYMNDVKELCHKKGECFVYWLEAIFDDKYLSRQTQALNALEATLKTK